MFGIESGTAVDYHELNAGAHRKPPKVLSAPSLVWHLAFWTNLPELDGHGKPLRNDCGGIKKKDPQEIREAVDRYILALYNAILKNEHVDKGRIDSGGVNLDGEAHIHGHSPGVQLTPLILGAYLLFDSAYAEQSFAAIPVASLLTRQKDIFESTTRTVALQFVWRQLDVSIRFEVRTECFTISTFVELDKGREKARDRRRFSSIPDLNECIGSVVDYLNGAPDPPQSTPGAPAPAVDGERLAASINKYCFHAFWKTYQAEVLSDDALMSWAGDAVFRHIFADFRGIVVSDQAIRFPDDQFFGNSKPANWGSEAKKKFLPLIQHRDRSMHSRYECTVNYMLDGRALYMSTLGPQLLHPSMSEAERIPVEFIVYAHQRYNDTTIVNKWQLGRLVNQILLLGTFRLCALKDVKSLHHAGRQLSQLEQRTQAARDEIASTETSPGAGNPDGEQGETATPNDETVMRLIGNAHETLNKITGDFLTTGSGLFYRIERSRYYVKQFDENVKLLRIGRLEGDQPYDQFIRRRLGSEFDFIDRLGIRYERAANNVAALDQNYLAITQNALVKQANKIDRDIHRIQKYGELLLLAALAPYYVAHLALLIWGEEHGVTVAANIWIAFAIGAFVNFYEIGPKYLKRFKWPAILATAAVILLVGACLIPPFEVMLRNREHDQHEQKLTESIEREVGVLRKLLETRQPPDDGGKAVPPAGQTAPPAPAAPTPNPQKPGKGGD